jgi:hypothetical protein
MVDYVTYCRLPSLLTDKRAEMDSEGVLRAGEGAEMITPKEWWRGRESVAQR